MRSRNRAPLLGISKIIRRENKPKKHFPAHTPAAATFLYKPGVELPNLSNYINQIIEIRIACEYINRANQGVILR